MQRVRRSLTPEEVVAYSRLADALDASEAAILREQLAAATIRDDDDEHGSFFFNGPVPALKANQSMTGSYDDADGWPIDLILHPVSGVLSWVERYRTDAGPIRDKRMPRPSEIRLSDPKISGRTTI